MPDLHGWITRQIDEAERLARRAAELCGCHPPAPSWSFRDGDEPTDGRILVVDEPHRTLKRKIGRRWNRSYEGLFMAEHIVRHDPAAVLRRCTADRSMLADLLAEKHTVCEDSWYHCVAADDNGDRDCNQPCSCGRDERVERWLRLLAEGYGYEEEQPDA